MAIALISDIHSNIEALTSVLADIKEQGIKDIYCLGDLVGYGPDPVPIVDAAREWKLVVIGNHDEAVLKEAYGFNPVARTAVNWTRGQLRPGIFSGRVKKDRWGFLGSLGLTHAQDGITFLHGSPRDPTMEYVLRSDCMDLTGGVPEKIRDIFSRFDKLCFGGHSHDPGFITEDAQFISPKECDHQIKLDDDKKYFINIGSVGQPRDGDVRSCYAIWHDDTNKVEWRRVEYDYRKTMEKIFNIPQLDRRAGDRLQTGR